jgi:hypothetical protein
MSAYQDQFIHQYQLPSSKVDLILYKCGINGVGSSYKANPEQVFGTMVHNLDTLLAGEKQEPFEYEVYGSWWDHFKDRFFGEWLKAKFPVIKIKKYLTLDLVYPRLTAKLPPDMMGDRVTVYVNRVPKFTFDPSLGPEDPVGWRNEMYNKKLSDYKSCPYCRRKIFDENKT